MQVTRVFQSTHPVRGATGVHQRYIYFRCLFQSTHPVRGATLPWLAGYRVFKISIHAPRAGCDISQPCLSGDMPRFQSTHPVRGATLPMFPSDRVWIISIHAPRAGCDRCAGYSSNSLRISIHAPRAGCDHFHIDYNGIARISIHAPRAGCDQKSDKIPMQSLQFQSTHPVRGAT